VRAKKVVPLARGAALTWIFHQLVASGYGAMALQVLG
jgi:hypothetical protein